MKKVAVISLILSLLFSFIFAEEKSAPPKYKDDNPVEENDPELLYEQGKAAGMAASGSTRSSSCLGCIAGFLLPGGCGCLGATALSYFMGVSIPEEAYSNGDAYYNGFSRAYTDKMKSSKAKAACMSGILGSFLTTVPIITLVILELTNVTDIIPLF